MTGSAIFTTIVVLILLVALMKEWMRPGLILFSGAVVFLCAGIIGPKELLEGFSNKGMITVALLFLVSEGVRRSGLLEQLLVRLLPKGKSGVRRVQARMLPIVAALSAFLNNTPMVVIFGPMIKRWAGVKDFSSVFPGHGGVMDRLDSILLCTPVVLCTFTILQLFGIY